MTTKHTTGPWVGFCNLTQTYTTPDGTRVSSELADNVACLADVLHVASIRQHQRDHIKDPDFKEKQMNNEALREAAEKMVEATNYRAAVFAASNDVNKQQFADTKFWEAHDNLDAALCQQKENNQICPVNSKELSETL